MADGENHGARERRDWTSHLPASLLVCILSLLPLRTALLCGFVSKAWEAAQRELLASAADLDFGPAFAQGLDGEQYSRAVMSALALRGAETPLGRARMFFQVRSGAALSRLEAMLALASSKRARMLELDLFVDPELMMSDSDLARLLEPWAFTRAPCAWRSLTRLSFNWEPEEDDYRYEPAPKITKPLDLPLLQSLCLRGVDVSLILSSLFESCPLLSTLKLIECGVAFDIKISSYSLRKLAIIKCGVIYDFEVDAPALRNFYFYGHVENIKLKDVTGLEDVHIRASPYSRYEDWSFLFDVVHVTTLTLCDTSFATLVDSVWLKDLTKLMFSNLLTLRLSTKKNSCYDVRRVENFLDACRFPVLESLFIGWVLSDLVDHYYGELFRVPIPVVPLPKLRLVSIKGFEGLGYEYRLVKFFLRNATSLETLVVRVSQYCEDKLVDFQEKLEAIPEANESVKILLRKDGDELVGRSAA